MSSDFSSSLSAQLDTGIKIMTSLSLGQCGTLNRLHETEGHAVHVVIYPRVAMHANPHGLCFQRQLQTGPSPFENKIVEYLEKDRRAWEGRRLVPCTICG